MVIECDFNINLAALTLEEVLGKRRKVVKDMCDQLALKTRHDAQGESWRSLRTTGEDAAKPLSQAVELFIEKRLMPLATKDPSFYNENAPLGEAIGEAVAVADIVAGWAEELHALAEVAGVGADVEVARKAFDETAWVDTSKVQPVHHVDLVELERQLARLRGGFGQYEVGTKVMYQGREMTVTQTHDPNEIKMVEMSGVGAVTVEQLMQWEGPLAIFLRMEENKRRVIACVRASESVPTDVMHGLCALMWVAHVKGAPLILDLSKRQIGAEGLSVLARGMAPSLTTLLLDQGECTNTGGDFSGLKLLCSALEIALFDGLKELRCALPAQSAHCGICSHGMHLTCTLCASAVLFAVLRSLANNHLGVKGATMVADVLENRIAASHL